MNKKKLKKTMIIGILMFYIISSVCMLLILEDSQEDEFKSSLNNIISGHFVENVADYFSDIDINSKEKSDEVAKLFMHYYADSISGYNFSYRHPFSLAIQDREGNITYLSKNFFYWPLDDLYVTLDEYLTDEIRKELKNVRKDKYKALVDELRLYYDGEKYIPVEVDFVGQGNFYKDYRKTIKFTDYKPNKIIVNNPVALGVCLLELETEFYNRPYYAKLKTSLNYEYDRLKESVDEHFGTSFGTVGYSGKSDGLVGNMDVAIGDGYRMYFAFRYNSYLVTLFSDYYQSILMFLAIIFSVAGSIFYIMCMKVVNKNEKLEEAKATFISAASHELKTPIAVIQNRCECLMEDIVPEKKDSYIKAIYDEALRMDGIVASLLTYNRLNQLTHTEKERCNLSELLKQEIKSYLAFAQKSGVVFEESIEGEVYADCNVQLMKMAVDNYLSNAVRYAKGDRRVTVSLRKKEKGFVLEVTNEAEESSAVQAREAWQEFSRGDKSRQRQGTSIGMGLPICKKIFELHGFEGYCRYKDGKVTFVIEGR